MIARFFVIWFVMAAGLALGLFCWRLVTKEMVWTAAKLSVAGILSFLLAMFFFIMET